MTRKRITQVFPWLLPLRTKQRRLFFYVGMEFDKNRYATTLQNTLFPNVLFRTNSILYNENTGFDMAYQENKVFNLKLAAAALDKLIIQPNETFSFWRGIKGADKATPYKDGLTVIDGELTTSQGGGLCQLSNLLFIMFLHSPLTIVERHGHGSKEFPDPVSGGPVGVDATIAEGWLDLKVKNETDSPIQINITFDDESIYGSLLTAANNDVSYQVVNGRPEYHRKDGSTYEVVDVFQNVISRQTGDWSSSKLLYRNRCKIGYPLPEGTKIVERG
jgi:vancomycin resistance protein VanW